MVDHDGTLGGLLRRWSAERPDDEVLVFEDSEGRCDRYTYEQLQARVTTTADGLAAELAVGAGTRVLMHMGTSPECVVLWFALANLGAVLIPSNTGNTASELGYLVGHSGAELVVTDDEFLGLVTRVVADAPRVREVVVAARAHEERREGLRYLDGLRGPARAASPVRASDLVQIVYTSGTSARPKGVMLTHANCINGGRRATLALTGRGHRFLTALPLFHVNAQTNTVLAALTLGGCAILLEQYSASRYWRQVQQHRATQMSIVAMQLRTMLAQERRDGEDDHDLQAVLYAIAVPEETKLAFEHRFGVRIGNGYGLTEAMTTVCRATPDDPWPSIGQPVADLEVAIHSESGAVLPPGDVGEIVVRGELGASLMLGYLDDPIATKAAFRDGWLLTGDLGRRDDAGRFYFVDRAKDVIKHRGENISATEVEHVLVAHPAVAEAAVIGVPDAIADEAVKAFVVAVKGREIDIEDLLTHCRTHLARFKVPAAIEIRTALPRSNVGKVAKRVLREELADA